MVIQLCRLWAYVPVKSASALAAGRRRVMVVWVEIAAPSAKAGGIETERQRAGAILFLLNT